jgi:hypothetical protein
MLRLSARGWLLLDRLAVEYAGPVGKNAAPRVVQMADRAWPGSGLADV